jgi:hypothetical protein
MKTNNLLFIFAFVVLGVIALYCFFYSAHNPTSSGLEHNDVTHLTIPSAELQGANENTNDSKIINGLFRTVVDPESGSYAIVNTNKDTVTLINKSENVVWATNVIGGTQSMPIIGERKIHGLQVYKGDLWISVGKGYVLVSLKNGDVIGLASN